MLKASSAPSIETARLRLRAHRVDDLGAALAMWSDPLVTRYIGGKPSTEQQTWSRILNYAGHWSLLGFGYWAVEERASERFVGECGFADFKRAIEPAMRDVPELGWAFATEFHGRGYATEAVRAAAAWGDDRAFARTVCLIDAGNGQSMRVAEKCGFVPFLRTPYGTSDSTFFERLRG